MARVNNKQDQYHIGGGQHLTVKLSHTIQMKDNLVLFTGDTTNPVIELHIDIKADFEKIPTEWHQTLTQMMMVRYGGVIKLDSNTKPFTVPFKTKRRWYNFLRIFK
jgi:ABC-type arginine transport system ATPase subunit